MDEVYQIEFSEFKFLTFQLPFDFGSSLTTICF